MSTITVKGWYQLDFKMKNPTVDLKKIDTVTEKLVKEGLISKWFFLFEGSTIRVRIESPNKDKLYKKLNKLVNEYGLKYAENLSFSEYTEDSESLFNEETIKRFANIMSEITQLTIKKIKQNNQFDTYRIMERISHCLFNNMAGVSLKSEEHFLTQRFKERVSQTFDGDFENKIADNQSNLVK